MEEIINDYEYPSLLADIKKTNYGEKELIDLWDAIDDESPTYMERSDYDIARAIVYLTNRITEYRKLETKIRKILDKQYELFNSKNQKEYSQEVVDVLEDLLEDK